MGPCRRTVVGIALAVAALLTACSEEDPYDLSELSDGELRTGLVNALREGDAMDGDTAECLTDGIVAAFGRQTLTRLVSGDVGALSDEELDGIADAADSCATID